MKFFIVYWWLLCVLLASIVAVVLASSHPTPESTLRVEIIENGKPKGQIIFLKPGEKIEFTLGSPK